MTRMMIMLPGDPSTAITLQRNTIVCQIPFLMAKCKAGKAFGLTLELSEASLKCSKDKAGIIEDVYSCIRANAQQLSQFPELVPQLFLNEPDMSYCVTLAQEYLKNANNSRGNKITLWRDLTKLNARKTNVAAFRHPAAVRNCVFSKGCKYLATHTTDGVLRVFMVASGYTVMTRNCECHVISFPAAIDQCHWVAVAETNSIVRYGLGSGSKHEGTILQEIKVDCDIDDRASIVITKKGKVWEIFLATSHGKLRSYSTSPSAHGQPVLKEELPRRPKVLTISPDGNLLAFGSDKLYLWNAKSQKEVKVFDTGKKTAPKMDGANLSFSRTGAKLGAVLPSGTYIWITQSGKLLKTLAMTTVGVEFVVFSPELDYIGTPDLKDKEDLKVFCMAPKPYDKHPEWETLTGHSAAVRACCIGNRESGHPLIATASDDCTVQLWDTRNMPSPKVVKLPEHNGIVQDCSFSSDDKLAVSCSATETWVWQAHPRVHRLHQLHPASGAGESGTCPCFSEDSDFVSVFVKTGVDVWHLKSGVDRHGSDTTLVMGAHRTLTLLTVRHLFTKFTSDGLYCCLLTESEPSTIRLYLAVNKYALDEWAKHELKDPPPNDLNNREPFEQRFSVDEGLKVTEAAISSSCGKLAAMSIPQQSSAQDAMKGPVEVHLWDLNNHTNWKVLLSKQSSISRQLTVGCDYLVTFVQTRKNISETGRLKSGLSRRSANSAYSFVDEAVIHIIDKRGSALQTLDILGKFSGVSVTGGDESTLRGIFDGLLAYGLHEGVVTAQSVKTGEGLGTFTVNNTEITAINFASNGRCAVVGCANGSVDIIEMI